MSTRRRAGGIRPPDELSLRSGSPGWPSVGVLASTIGESPDAAETGGGDDRRVIRRACVSFAVSALLCAATAGSAWALAAPVATQPEGAAASLQRLGKLPLAAMTSTARAKRLVQPLPIRPGNPPLRVGAAWRSVGLTPAAESRVVTLGILPHGSRGYYLDSQRDAVVVGGTLTALSLVTLLI